MKMDCHELILSYCGRYRRIWFVCLIYSFLVVAMPLRVVPEMGICLFQSGRSPCVRPPPPRGDPSLGPKSITLGTEGSKEKFSLGHTGTGHWGGPSLGDRPPPMGGEWSPSNTEALCQPPPPPPMCTWHVPHHDGKSPGNVIKRGVGGTRQLTGRPTYLLELG